MSESVSLQHTLMQTHAAEKVYQLERQHPETEQQRFSLELERRDLEDQQRAPPSVHVEGGRIDREQERRKGEHRRKGSFALSKSIDGAPGKESASVSEGGEEVDVRGRFVDLRV